MADTPAYDPILMPELPATALSRYDERVAVRLGGKDVTYRSGQDRRVP